MGTQATTGYFGKLPVSGDFISRGLPRTFIEPWDKWLQAGIVYSREQLGTQWLDLYLTSPVWCFAWRASRQEPTGWLGVMIPSVDRVGRYFPFALALPVRDTRVLLYRAENAEPWFDQATQLALSALEPGFDLETMNDEVDGLSLSLSASVQWGPGGSGLRRGVTADRAWALNLPPPRQLPQILAILTTDLLTEAFSTYSLWWTKGSEHVAPCALVCRDLPPVAGFASLLNGQWDREGWHHMLSMVAEPDAISAEATSKEP